MPKDFYTVLDVPKGADEKDIKASYRRLARKFHPDVNPNDKAAEARFKEISEAYETLSDPEKRKLYDQYGHDYEHAQHFAGQATQGGGQNFGGGGFESIFETFFSGGGRGFRMQDVEVMQPRDVEQTLKLTLEEIDTGTKRVLTFQTMDAQRTRDGVSTVPTTKKVEVNVPAGIADGKKIRHQGKGAVGGNGKAGDLYVNIVWLPHDKFKVNGENLEIEVPVLFTTAALGGEITVPTLKKSVSVRIPAGTQSGQSLRWAGQGIARYGGGRSDLMVKVKITVPKSLSDKEKALLTELAELQAVKP